MPEIILHHYPPSPVSEKIRTVLGIKGLAWRSVEIPRLPPRPDLMPLAGGYRLTPVMQIGADVFCDSLCIARAIQERYPEPTLYPGGADGMVWGVSRWTDGAFFQTVLRIVFGAGHRDMPGEFVADAATGACDQNGGHSLFFLSSIAGDEHGHAPALLRFLEPGAVVDRKSKVRTGDEGGAAIGQANRDKSPSKPLSESTCSTSQDSRAITCESASAAARATASPLTTKTVSNGSQSAHPGTSRQEI